MKVILSRPRGFCAGVKRAIDTVERVLAQYGAPVYVYHEVVHNRYVVEKLRRSGAIFVNALEEVPDNAALIFSAHGVSKSIRNAAEARGLALVDATCPLVRKVHDEVIRWRKNAITVIMIGHAGHAEVIGTMGQVKDGIFLVSKENDVDTLPVIKGPVGYVMQTTLSLDEAANIVSKLKKRFPNIQEPKKDDICYATRNRQTAVKVVANMADVMLIVGSPNSSNSNRLREVAKQQGRDAFLIDSAEDINPEWFKEANVIGISAGASAPEILVKQVIERLSVWFPIEIEEMAGVEERVVFSLPFPLKESQHLKP